MQLNEVLIAYYYEWWVTDDSSYKRNEPYHFKYLQLIATKMLKVWQLHD